MHICMYMGFVLILFGVRGTFWNCAESLIRFGKFSDSIHSHAAIVCFFPHLSYYTFVILFDPVLHIFYAVQFFSFFFILFLLGLQFQIHMSENLDIFYWVCLSFSNCAFSSCCFTLKISSKFLITDFMFFNYRMSILLLLFGTFQNCWNSSFHPFVCFFLFLHKWIILSYQVYWKMIYIK